MAKPISFRPSSGPSVKCSSASASLPGGLPLSFGVILTSMVVLPPRGSGTRGCPASLQRSCHARPFTDFAGNSPKRARPPCAARHQRQPRLAPPIGRPRACRDVAGTGCRIPLDRGTVGPDAAVHGARCGGAPRVHVAATAGCAPTTWQPRPGPRRWRRSVATSRIWRAFVRCMARRCGWSARRSRPARPDADAGDHERVGPGRGGGRRRLRASAAGRSAHRRRGRGACRLARHGGQCGGRGRDSA